MIKNLTIAALVAGLASACAASPPPSACKAQRSAGIAAYGRGDATAALGDFRAAALCGDSDAELDLGLLYARGEATGRPEPAEALRLYARSAEHGNAAAMNALGQAWQQGEAVPADFGKAVTWYCRAIARGNAAAMNNLALLHLRGRGVEQSIAAARDLWRQAADRDDAEAMYNLGLTELDGPGPQNREAGYALILEAAQRGDALAQRYLRRRGFTGELPPPRSDRVLPAEDIAAAPGHAAACGGSG